MAKRLFVSFKIACEWRKSSRFRWEKRFNLCGSTILKKYKSVYYKSFAQRQTRENDCHPSRKRPYKIWKRQLQAFWGPKLVDSYQPSAKLELSLGPRGDPFGAFSDLHGKDCHNTDIGVLIELYRDQAISLRIPESTCSWCNCGAIVLLDYASDNILELLLQFGEIFDARLDDLCGPLIYFLALVLNVLRADDIVDGILSDFLDGLGIELVLVIKFGHSFFFWFFKLYNQTLSKQRASK